MQKTTIPIRGMHCRSCELLIEDELSQVKGIEKAIVSEKKACAEIYYSGNINIRDVDAAVARAGYEVGLAQKKPLLAKEMNVYIDLVVSMVALFLLYILADMFGLSRIFATGAGHPTNILTVVLIGLTAGFSTCMALIGGLVLGASARFSAKHPDATARQRFAPHLMFNAGRIISYVFFGGVIGLLGSLFQLSGSTLGFVTLAVALVMLTLGVQLTGLFPRITSSSFTLPKGLGRLLGIEQHNTKEYSHKNSAILGGLTFFLPCGFTQAMQLYAMSTGNFFEGAAIMGAFALGTAPGLLGIGGLTSAIKGAFANTFFRFAGVVVIMLSLFNAQNGLNLLGISQAIPLGGNAIASNTVSIEMEGNTQIVRMTQDSSGYEPNLLTVVKDIPVKWIITSTDANTCAASIVVSKFGIQKSLHPGENVIEFTPQEIGKIPFSCSMGMFTGSFNVVANSQAQVQPGVPPPADSVNANFAGASCAGMGCGCGKGAQANANVPASVPVDAEESDGQQLIQTVYTSERDIAPNAFTVKAGRPVRMEIDVRDNGEGCMATITVPRLADDPKFLEKGETIVFEFTPREKGEYPITCAMGVPRGVIKVV